MQDNFRILRPFFRGLPIIVVVMILGAIAAKKYLSYVTPMYESTAKLKLADIGEGIPNGNLFKNFDVFASANKIAAEIEVLKSSELINKATSELDFNTEIYRVGSIQMVELYEDSPFKIKVLEPEGKVFDRKFKLVVSSLNNYEIFDDSGNKLTNGAFNSPIALLDNKIIVSLNQQLINSRKNLKIIDNYKFELFSNEKLLEKINKNIDIVSVDKDVPVIRINYKSNIPKKAALFVNKLAETYIYDYIESKYKAANVTVKFLDKQIEDAGQKLAQSENNIENYRNENKIVNMRQETETDLRKISQLKIQQTNLKMNLQAIDELNRYIEFGKDNFLSLAPNFEAFTDLLSTEIIKIIKKLQADKKDLLLTYTTSDERVKVIDEKLNDLVSYLIESIKNTKLNCQIKYDQITKDIEIAEQVFITVPGKEKNMTILNRNFDLLQTSYNFLNEKKIEAEIAQSAKISFHKVITPAFVSEKPISPNRPIIIILSAMLSLIGSIILIYTVHFFKAKVNDVYLIEKNTSIPIAVSTKFVTHDVEKEFQKNVLQLQLKGILTKGNILTITSNDSGEGKSFNLVNICKILSSQKRSVLIVDVQGDLNYLISNLIENTEIYRSNISNVDYLDLFSSNKKYFSNDEIKEIIFRYKNEYDFVIINNEYLKLESRSLLMMAIADSNLYVLDSRKTALKLLTRIEVLNNEFKFPQLTFILNKMGYNPNVIVEIFNWIKSFKK